MSIESYIKENAKKLGRTCIAPQIPSQMLAQARTSIAMNLDEKMILAVFDSDDTFIFKVPGNQGCVFSHDSLYLQAGYYKTPSERVLYKDIAGAAHLEYNEGYDDKPNKIIVLFLILKDGTFHIIRGKTRLLINRNEFVKLINGIIVLSGRTPLIPDSLICSQEKADDFNSVQENLIKIAQLKNEGVLTEEEFIEMKNKIIAKI